MQSVCQNKHAQHSSVIYYQHKARKQDEFYIRQHDKLIHTPEFAGSKGLALKFITTSQRYYFFIIQPQHQEIIVKAVSEMLAGPWKNHFRILTM